MRNGTDRGLCCEPRCKNRRRTDRLRCHTCDCRRKRANNPMRAAWRALKDHARARKSEAFPNGIPFTLDFEYWRRFAIQTDYLNRTGPNGHCLTVDRKDVLRGYVRGNIQPLTRSENAMKQARRDKIRMEAGMSWQGKYT